MGDLSQAEQYLLDQIRQGQSDGWTQLVDRYQGRLLAFARARAAQAADAEDLVQETFISFLRGLERFRGEASLETYLFHILRRKVVDHFRGRRLHACLLQDMLGAGDEAPEPLGQLPAPDLTASRYAADAEQDQNARDALAEALRTLVQRFKDALNFRDLALAEMLFYCQLRNRDAAQVAGMDEKQVALLKHRWLKQVREHVGRLGGQAPAGDAVLTVVWEHLRLSCPKRSTIGAMLLGTLEPAWREYVDFHVNRLGCRFCQANLEDLQRRITPPQAHALRERILESTVGFLRTSRP